MSYSIVGRCERRSTADAAITTSSSSVDSRCPWVGAGASAIILPGRYGPISATATDSGAR